MPGFGRLGRRAGPFTVALTAWDIWRRIPPQHRAVLVRQARTQGPKLVKSAVNAGRKAGKRR
jgi:hypothetical protein